MPRMSRPQRLFVGTFVLLLVDVIWVASSELTEYIFHNQKFNKPFFSTYLKTSMFALYMLGFIVWKPWRDQCINSRMNYTLVNNTTDEEEGTNGIDTSSVMSEPVYIPAKFQDESEKSSGTESDDTCAKLTRSVRFSKLAEVRQLSDSFADDANLARLSFSASIRAREAAARVANKLPIRQVAKIALLFCLVWYIGNFSYQEALSASNAGLVTILSSSSGLFTLILAAMFPSNSGDRFTISKLIAVLSSLGGVIVICISEVKLDYHIPKGAIWALLGALFYAVYIVLLRKKIDDEDRVDIPMFLGFVGLFNIILIWPGFALMHYAKLETFEWPTKDQWTFLVINGLVGTVISELLWLWACFLTSSLIATLSLSLTIPMTVLFDIFIKKEEYSNMFFIGSLPMFISFFALTSLAHYDNCDPIYDGFKAIAVKLCSKQRTVRLQEVDSEQTESLIGINSSYT